MNNNWPTKKLGENVNALVLVAHPDDETIFCGGTMLTYPKWNWQIVCVTMQRDTARPQEFQKAMAQYKNYGVHIYSYKTLEKEDVIGRDLSNEEIIDWKESIHKLNLSPDIVFTHNVEGEYGHNHHKSLNKIVCKLFPNVWEFVYPGDDNITSNPTKSEIKKVILIEDIKNKKSEIFNTCYTSQVSDIWYLLPGLLKYEFEIGPEIFTSGDEEK